MVARYRVYGEYASSVYSVKTYFNYSPHYMTR